MPREASAVLAALLLVAAAGTGSAIAQQRRPTVAADLGPVRQVEVVDGDTVSLKLTSGFVTGIKIRLEDINAPDGRSDCAEERAAAARATARLRELTARGVHVVSNLQTEAYGRFLARLYSKDARDLGQVLLAEGLAVPLGDREKRRPWCPAPTPIPPPPAPPN